MIKLFSSNSIEWEKISVETDHKYEILSWCLWLHTQTCCESKVSRGYWRRGQFLQPVEQRSKFQGAVVVVGGRQVLAWIFKVEN